MSNTKKIIYSECGTIGVDEDSLNKFDELMNILTPRMQKQLVDELHNNEVNKWLQTNRKINL